MKFLSKKVIAALAVALALLAGMTVGFVAIPLLAPAADQAIAGSQVEGSQPNEEQHGEPKIEPGMMYPMSERVVNLADPGGYRYLKIQVVLEFALPEAKNLKGEAYKKKQDEFAKEMASRRPVMEDIVLTVLSSKNSAQISTGEGREKLREELKGRFERVSGEHQLLNVYFTQMIIQ